MVPVVFGSYHDWRPSLSVPCVWIDKMGLEEQLDDTCVAVLGSH